MDPLTNLFYSELTGLPYGTGDTSFTLTAGSVADLPDADTEGAYNLVFWDREFASPAVAKREGGVYEIVRVTADDAGTDTITVTRGQEGTTAQSYSSGNTYGVIQAATKNLFDQISQSLIKQNTPSGNPSSGVRFAYYRDVQWDIMKSYLASTLDTSANTSSPHGIAIRKNGENIYITDISTDEVHQYKLYNKYDPQSAEYVTSLGVTTNADSPRGIGFSDDGTKMFIIGTSADDVAEYTLSTAWDISSATYSQSFSVSSQSSSPQGISFKPDGTAFYICDSGNNTVFEYTLSTAWDVSTASLGSSYDASSKVSSAHDLYVYKNKLLITEFGGTIHEYDLSTSWDVSSASFLVSFSTRERTMGITLETSNSIIYIVGNANNRVEAYKNPASLDQDLSEIVVLYPNGHEDVIRPERPIDGF